MAGTGGRADRLYSHSFVCVCVLCFETGPHCGVQAGLELSV